MNWLGFTASIASLAALAYLLFGRRRAARTRPAGVASYSEIKRRIRAGEVPAAPAAIPAAPPARPPPSLEETLRLQGHDFLGALVDHVARKALRTGEGSLCASEAALRYVWALEGEVTNGGLDQYFFNSSGDRARQALEGLDLIGAASTAAILRRACALFGEAGPSPDREARWNQMDRWTPEDKKVLSVLDDEFLAYPDPLADLLEQHARAHRGAFEP